MVSPVHAVREICPQFLEENVGEGGSSPLNRSLLEKWIKVANCHLCCLFVVPVVQLGFRWNKLGVSRGSRTALFKMKLAIRRLYDMIHNWVVATQIIFYVPPPQIWETSMTY